MEYVSNAISSIFSKTKPSEQNEAEKTTSKYETPKVVVEHLNPRKKSYEVCADCSSNFNGKKKSCDVHELTERYNLDSETLSHYKEAFRMFDKNNDGSITTNELGAVMHSLGSHVTSTELESLILQIDQDGNGTIEFEEFLRLMAERLQSQNEDDDDLKKAFEIFDKDKDGYVSAKDLRLIMRNLGEKVSETELKKMMEEVDKDKDGKLSFDEFQCMLKCSESEVKETL